LTQDKLVGTIAEHFGIDYGAMNTVVSAWAKVRWNRSRFSPRTNSAQLNQKDFVESANEHHMEAWANIITTSSPPLHNTPLSPYLDASMFNKQGTAYSNAKIKRILDYQLRHPKFTTIQVAEIINGFKTEGIWPNEA
jgi:hypothetical protein